MFPILMTSEVKALVVKGIATAGRIRCLCASALRSNNSPRILRASEAAFFG